MQGYGVRGGRGRCFPFFETFLECVNAAGNERGYKCVKQADDYKECLHHQKASERQAAVDAQKAKLAAEGKLSTDVDRLLTHDFVNGFKASN